MKRFISILLIGLFAVALAFAQEKTATPQPKAKKMECCKEGMKKCSGECYKMKSDAKGKKAECMKECKAKKGTTLKESAPEEVTPKPEAK